MNEENKDMTMKILGCIATACLFPSMLVIQAILGGFVLMRMWEWFIVPTFEWATPLTMPYAIGVSLVVGFLTHHRYTTKSQRKEVADNMPSEIWSDFLTTVIGAASVLLMGWIVVQFV